MDERKISLYLEFSIFFTLSMTESVRRSFSVTSRLKSVVGTPLLITISAASGSANTLNSALSVTFPGWSTAPPIRTISFRAGAKRSSLFSITARSVQGPTETKVISPGLAITWSMAHLMPFPWHCCFWRGGNTGPSKPFFPWIFPAVTLSRRRGDEEPANTGASISRASARFNVFSRVFSRTWFPAVAIRPSILILSLRPAAMAMAMASSCPVSTSSITLLIVFPSSRCRLFQGPALS